MSNFVDVIKACEAASGAGTKIAIKAALERADATAQRLIHYAMDPFRVFGVRKYAEATEAIDLNPANENYESVFSTLDKLATRELTGKAAQEAVTNMLCGFSKTSQEYLARILDKDLRAGFSASTFNTIHKNNKIPVFEVMLADKCDDTDDFEKYVTFPALAQLKLDGERTIAVVTKNDVVYYSRSGKIASHVNGLFDAELFRLREHLGYDFVIDGERYASNFTETMNAKKSGNDEAKNNLRFIVFFMMPYSDWLKQSTKITVRHNEAILRADLETIKAEKVIMVSGREVTDYKDMMDYCNEAIDVHKVEGLIVKDWESTYAWERTYAWTKVKRMWDADCRIVGFYTGRKGTRLENTLGGVSVVGFLEDGTRVETNVGSGFSDEMRNEIWNNQAKWLGQTAVIKYQEVSKAKNRETSSLRFPVFMHVRDDKVVEVD